MENVKKEKYILKFELSGKFACFKKPEINNSASTYNQIHKTIIKGIIGAIIGLKGYNTSNFLKENTVEFLDKLQNIKVGIVPKVHKGLFDTMVIDYSNQTGHANSNSTLLIYEKNLINPCWDIYLNLEDLDLDIKEKITDYLMNKKMEYNFYLGKNHYFGIIKNVEKLPYEKVEQPKYISSLFLSDSFELDTELEQNSLAYGDEDFCLLFPLPIDISMEIGYYNNKDFLFSNYLINKILDNNFECIKDDKNIIMLI